jgi:hypothetical protein
VVNRQVVLAVGEDFHLRQGKDHIIYAGMPSEDVYSIVQKRASGYQGYSWNLYFPRRQQEITIDGIKIFVESVAPQEISLRIG